MATKDDLLKELNWVTEKISTLLWTINLSTLGTTWSLLLGSTTIPAKFQLKVASAIPILSFCIVGMLFELGQFLIAYYNNRQALLTIEQSGATEFKYNPNAWSYRLRIWFFYLKIVFTLVGAILLLIQLFAKLM